ncbi:MAG: glycosyltransferase family 4 protein [Cyanobacteria bacterium M_surface_10_m2_119]|nr:glycosyltransferase family 4 protein [Cyanobacteria bacterium M_surface_10_m2_119]
MLRVGVLAQAPGGPLTSSAWIRLLLPLRRLEQQGACAVVPLEAAATDDAPALVLDGLDRLIVQRAACPTLEVAEALVQACRQRSLPLILDLDDALFALPAEHPERGRYAPALPALEHLLVAADLRVFSTATLASQCESFGPQAVLANGLDAEAWAGPARFPRAEAEGPLQLLYMGSRTHDADLALILPELDALADRDPDAFRLTLVGGVSQPLQRPWLLTVEVPLEARRYPRFVRWLRRLPRHDLGLAPLVANPFNAAKSDVKLLDYAALGLPALCSPGPAYQELLAAGLALPAEPGQWAEQIGWAAGHRRRLRRLAQAAHGYLWEQRSSEQVARCWQQQVLCA